MIQSLQLYLHQDNFVPPDFSKTAGNIKKVHTFASPPVVLKGWSEHGGFSQGYIGKNTFPEHYHHALLHTANEADVYLGYLSTIYWGCLRKQGNYASALSYVQRASKKNSSDLVYSMIQTACVTIANNEFKNTIRILNLLSYTGFYLSSILMSFIDPAKCGIMDMPLVTKLNEGRIVFRLTPGRQIKSCKKNYAGYQKYCEWLQQMSYYLNQSGYEAGRGGTKRPWTAFEIAKILH